MKVLIADDDFLQRMDYVEIVERAGCPTVEVADGTKAFLILNDRSNGITHLITDVGMPGGSGYALVNHLVAACRRLPILVHSAHGRHRDGETIVDLASWAKTSGVGYGPEISFSLKLGGEKSPAVYIPDFLTRNVHHARRTSILAAE